MAKKKAGEPTGGPSKMQMVREALDTLGGDAKPKAIAEHVKGKYGADLPAAMISSYKSTISSGGASKSRAWIGGGGSVSVGDLEAVKTLVDRLGARQLESLVRLLAK